MEADEEVDEEVDEDELTLAPQPQPAPRRVNKIITPMSGVIVNTSLCKYSAVRRSADGMGWTECDEGRENWQMFWTDLSVNHMRVRALQPLQRINHFPDMTRLCNKAESALVLRQMIKYFQHEYHFFPQSWSLPKEMAAVVAHLQPQQGGTFPTALIVKPSRGCQGTDVRKGLAFNPCSARRELGVAGTSLLPPPNCQAVH